MRRVTTFAVSVALAFIALGAAVLPLQSRAFTRALSGRYSHWQEAGLTRPRMLEVAEQVRAFVVSGRGSLPAQVDGRSGFDADAVSHLEDVADVLRSARWVLVAFLALAVAWGAVALARRRRDDVASALKGGAAVTLALPVLAGLAGAIDFDALFTAFHGLFFSAGTWTFPYDSLLILTFPEPFWVACGVAWAVLVASMAAVYGVAGTVLGRITLRDAR